MKQNVNRNMNVEVLAMKYKEIYNSIQAIHGF